VWELKINNPRRRRRFGQSPINRPYGNGCRALLDIFAIFQLQFSNQERKKTKKIHASASAICAKCKMAARLEITVSFALAATVLCSILGHCEMSVYPGKPKNSTLHPYTLRLKFEWNGMAQEAAKGGGHLVLCIPCTRYMHSRSCEEFPNQTKTPTHYASAKIENQLQRH